MKDNWDLFFMKMVYLIANKSKDTSTKIGAIIVNDNNQIIKIGYNGFPLGVDDSVEERFHRPVKYAYTAHAEVNAIFLLLETAQKLKDLNYIQMRCVAMIVQRRLFKREFDR